ncbi:MAG: AAA family ATPase [Lachnospiraceae bacterium]|nr:AAA family ATPase [Lachnospiraceae bacterium]
MKVCNLAMEEIKVGTGQLVLVGGRPAIGKTAFAISIVLEMAMKGYKTVFFSMEMSKEGWIERASKRMHIIPDDLPISNIDIIDEAAISVDRIAELSTVENRYDLIVVDYLQLIDRGDGSVVDVLNDLNALSVKLRCPIMILSQLNRSIDVRDDHKPMMDDLVLANINIDLFGQVFLLYRDYYYNRDADETKLIVIMKDKEVLLKWDYQSISVV